MERKDQDLLAKSSCGCKNKERCTECVELIKKLKK